MDVKGMTLNNRILGTLSASDRAMLLPQFEHVELETWQVLEKPNAAGSYCDVVAPTGAASDQSDTSAPVVDKVTTSPPAATSSSGSQTGNAAGGSAASP